MITMVIVRNPLEYHVGKTRYSSLLHLSIFIAPALIAAFLINVPKFLETELVWIEREEVGILYSSVSNSGQFGWDLAGTIWTIGHLGKL